MTGLIATSLERPPMLQRTDLALSPGQLVALVGPNGAGKTTLLRALAGLSNGGGTVSVGGSALSTLNPALRARRLAWLPADRDIAWPLSGRDLVQLGLGPGAARNESAVLTALEMADASAFADRRVNTLSTGERARVLLARALVARPDWLLLDEPVANLDPWHRLDIMALLAREAARGAGVVVALHDLELAARCDRVLLMHQGAVVGDGPPAEVLAEGPLRAIFGIRRGVSGWEQAG